MDRHAEEWLEANSHLDPVRYDRSHGVFTAYPDDPRFQLIARRRLDRGDPEPTCSIGKQATFGNVELAEARRLFGHEISHRDPYGD